MSSPPAGIAGPWADLLSRRALLHQTYRQFSGLDDFGKKLSSQRLDDRKDCAALEAFAEGAFHVILELTAAVLIARSPEDREGIKRMGAKDARGSVVATISRVGLGEGPRHILHRGPRPPPDFAAILAT